MTEYDYSPEAYEQHLAKQARIARWVDNTNEYTPANPFRPLPGVPDERSSPSPSGPRLQSDVPPAPNTSGAARRHKARHNRHQSNITINPPPAALGLPLGEGLYLGGKVARQPQLAKPMSAGSITMTSLSPKNQWFPYRSPPFRSLTASAVQVPFGSQTQFPGYPYGQPYPSPPISSSSQSPYQPNANSVYSHAPYASSSVQSLPLPASSTSSVVPYPQGPNQPVVLPLSGGGFVVLPPGQQVQVLSAKNFYGTERIRDSSSDYSGPSFFGSLGMGGKKPNGSRR